ncbi:sensor histidine kinase [Austwickia chelonae]|uniref:sensor histidine kinase n=1 Tax=Austwickia chelonae TaxID=100225 RepID=UPI0013C2CE3B|nr:HAMP domain-containing sensor histidine kinase [Austwickia chelonae]
MSWTSPPPAEGRPPGRRAFGMSFRQAYLCVVVVYLFSLVWSFAVYDEAERVSLSWTLPPAQLALLSLVWPQRRSTAGRPEQRTRPRSAATMLTHDRRLWWGTYLFLWVTAVGGGLAFHLPFLPLLWTSTSSLVLYSLLLAAYQRWRQGDEWFPLAPRDVMLFTSLTTVSSWAAVYIGALPGIDLGGPHDTELAVWWATLVQLTLLYGGLLAFAAVHPLRIASSIYYPMLLPVTAIASTACLVLLTIEFEQPIKWLLFVPALLIGLTLTPRRAAATLLLLPLFSHSLKLALVDDNAPTSEIMPTAATQLLYVAGAVLGCFLVGYRESHARLAERLAEAAKEENAQNILLDAVLSSMDDGVLLIDGEGEVVLSNPSARSLLGAPPTSVDTDLPAEERWLAAFAVRDGAGHLIDVGEFRKWLDTGPEESSHLVVSTTGSSRVGADTGQKDVGGAEQRVAATHRMLEHRRKQLRLILLRDVTAEQAREQELEAFAGTVAHDLKGPLAAVALWMDTADIEADDDIRAGRRALARALSAGQQMGNIIDDCLAYTVAREGVLQISDLSLAEVTREIALSYHHREGVHIEVDTDAVVHADPTLVRRLMGNLVGNAVKYARPDEPAWVRVRSCPAGSPGWVRILVEDKGIGVDEEDAAVIFTRFGRTAKGAADQQGTGLGLAMCHSIVARHHGRIRAYRNEWGGATFEFTLPQGLALVS